MPTTTQTDFTKRGKKAHNNKYKYLKTNYINSKIKITITCPKHGNFEQFPSSHLQGKGCYLCGRETSGKKLSQKSKSNIIEFIQISNKIHKNKYVYSFTIYTGVDKKIIVTCPQHGKFQTTPYHHITRKQGCLKCSRIKTGQAKQSNKSEFVKKAKKVHGNKYTYVQVIYSKSRFKVIITCKRHGDFKQTPNDHLNGYGCNPCGLEKRSKNRTQSKNEFFDKVKKVHGNRYDYSETEFTGVNLKIKINCKKHGVFEQRAGGHLNGYNCLTCSNEENGKKQTLTNKDFIKKAKKRHGNKFDYSKLKYVNSKTKITILCKKHGNFTTLPSTHLHRGSGCHGCIESRGEKKIKEFLLKNKINFTQQKRFPKCKHKQQLSYDFYLPRRKILIEYDGKQHFHRTSWNKETLELIQLRDSIKTKWAKNNNHNLIRIPYTEIDNIKTILTKNLKPQSNILANSAAREKWRK